MGLQFNRTVSPELLVEIRPGGRFDGLVRRRNELPTVADVQLRRARGPECHASLYIGLTSVLNVRERRGLFALSAHKTHRAAGGFDPAWLVFRSADALAGDWPAVEAYLDRLLDARIDPRWYRREGVLHALMCSGGSDAYGVIQREAAPWADGPPLVRDIVESTSDRIWTATQAGGRIERWWPGIRDRGARNRTELPTRHLTWRVTPGRLFGAGLLVPVHLGRDAPRLPGRRVGANLGRGPVGFHACIGV